MRVWRWKKMGLFGSLHEKIVTRIHIPPRKEEMLNTVKEKLKTHQNASKPHKVVQMIISAYLLSEGYDMVKVEYPLKELLDPEEVKELRVDVFGSKQSGNRRQVIFLEVETGHVPASHYTDQATYRRSRDSAKVSRYFYPYPFISGKEVDRIFGLVVPRFYIAQLPRFYTRPPKKRRETEIKLEKNVLDRYYNSPPIPIQKVKRARVDYIFEIIPDLLLERAANNFSWLKKSPAKSYLKQNESRIMPVGTFH